MANANLGPFVELAQLQRFKGKADQLYATKAELAGSAITAGDGLEKDGNVVKLSGLVGRGTTVTGAADAKLAGLKVVGACAQDGTPSPDSPVAVAHTVMTAFKSTLGNEDTTVNLAVELYGLANGTGDSIEVDQYGNVKLTRVCGKLAIGDFDTVFRNTDDHTTFQATPSNVQTYAYGSTSPMFCTHATVVNQNMDWNPGTISGSHTGTVFLNVDPSIDTVAQLAEAYPALEVVYKLKTPVVTTLGAVTMPQVGDGCVISVVRTGAEPNLVEAKWWLEAAQELVDGQAVQDSRMGSIESASETNVIEVVKVNGSALTPDSDKAVNVPVPTTLSALVNDGSFVTDASYVHTDENYTSAEKSKLSGVESGAQANVIEAVKVNGTALTPSSKAVDVTVPTKVSDLSNDSGFQTQSQVETAINAAVAGLYDYKGSVATYSALPQSGMEVGDVYNVQQEYQNVPAGANYAWNGTSWDPLGGEIDLSGYATLASPALTGTPTAPTAPASTDTTQVATTAFVHDVVESETVTSFRQSGTGASVQTDGSMLLSVTGEGWATQGTTTGKNLIPFPYQSSAGTYENVAFSYDNDGKMHASGTSSNGTNFNLLTTTASETFEEGTYTLSVIGTFTNAILYVRDASSNEIVFISASNTSKTFTLESATKVRIYVNVPTANKAVSIDAYIQLEAGSTATEYEPYTGGAPSPSPDYPQDISVARGRNLFDKDNISVFNGYPDRNAMKFVSNAGHHIYYVPCEPNTEYVISKLRTISSATRFGMVFSAAIPSNNGAIASFAGEINNSGTIGERISITGTSDANAKYLCVWAYWGEENANNAVDNSLQLELGSAPTPYVPYGCVGMEVQGRNLFDKTTVTAKKTVSPTDGSITGNASTNNASDYIDVVPGSVYYLPYQDATHNRFAWYNSAKQFISGFETYGFITAPTNAEYIRITVLTDKLDSTNFRSYSTTPIPLPTRSDGGKWAAGLTGAKDVLGIDSVGHVEWRLKTDEYTFDGDESWTLGSNGLFASANIGCANSIGMSNRFILNDDPASNANTFNPYSGKIFVNCSGKSMVSDFTTWLASNPSTFLVKLATPTSYDAGYVRMPDIPAGATVSIPELDVIGVEWAVSRLDGIQDVAKDLDAKAEALYKRKDEVGDGFAKVIVGATTVSADAETDTLTLVAGQNVTLTADASADSVTIAATDTTYTDATASAAGLMSASDKEKLDGISSGAFAPTAGDGLTLTGTALSLGPLVKSATGAEVVTDGCAIFGVTGEGWSRQESTTGKNLLNPTFAGDANIRKNADGSYTVISAPSANYSGTFGSVTLVGGTTYTMTKAVGSRFRCVLTVNSNNVPVTDTPVTFTPNSDTTLSVAFVLETSAVAGDTIYPQIELGSTATTYEPYTGGQPSPSPDFPQEIAVARGRNLLDESNYHEFGINSANGIIQSTSGRFALYAKVVPGETYTLSISAAGALSYFYYGFYASEPIAGISPVSYENLGTSSLGKTVTAPSGAYWICVFFGTGKPIGAQLELGSHPTPYVPYGNVGLEVQGRNLWNPNSKTSGKFIGFSGSETSSGLWNCSGYIGVESSGYYVTSGITKTDNSTGIGWYDESKSFISFVSTTNTKNTSFSSPSNAAFMRVSVHNDDIATYQIERGTTAHAYEPYHHTTTPIPLPTRSDGDKWLAALPDGTADTLEIDSAGHVASVKKTAELSLAANSMSNNEDYPGWTGSGIKDIIGTGLNGYISSSLCSHVRNGQACINTLSNNDTVFFFASYIGYTQTEFKTAAAGETVKFIVPRTVPVTQDLGYIDLPELPEGATVSIPELEAIGVSWFVQGAEGIVEHITNERKRAEAKYAELEEAIADL